MWYTDRMETGWKHGFPKTVKTCPSFKLQAEGEKHTLRVPHLDTACPYSKI